MDKWDPLEPFKKTAPANPEPKTGDALKKGGKKGKVKKGARRGGPSGLAAGLTAGLVAGLAAGVALHHFIQRAWRRPGKP